MYHFTTNGNGLCEFSALIDAVTAASHAARREGVDVKVYGDKRGGLCAVLPAVQDLCRRCGALLDCDDTGGLCGQCWDERGEGWA